MPCRGTGSVISNLGGEPKGVRCPWCEGTGKRIAGIDAQAHWQADSADGGGQSGRPADSQANSQAASQAA